MRSLYGRGKNLSSLINQTNTSGGVKKAGLPPTVGVNASVGAIYRKRIGCSLNCPFIISSTRSCSYIGKTIKTSNC